MKSSGPQIHLIGGHDERIEVLGVRARLKGEKPIKILNQHRYKSDLASLAVPHLTRHIIRRVSHCSESSSYYTWNSELLV
jgi:hypothetical protein